jgi:ribosomal protein S20
MPIIKSAVKKMKQDQRRYAQNLRTKRALREASKSFIDKPTFDGLRTVQSAIDTAVKKNVLKRNTAARRLSRFSRIAKEAGVKIPAPAKKVAAKPATKSVSKTSAPAATTTKTASAKPTTKKSAAKSAATIAKKSTAKKPVAKKPAAKK